MKHYQQLLLASATAALLTACGGSSSNSSPSKNPTPTTKTATGVLSDSPVDGVGYATSSGKTGKTQNGGKFEYIVGDEVIFSLGDFILGSYKPTHADETVTPVELTQAIPDPTHRDFAITNLLVLLQSLDIDGNPDNGINIADETTFSTEDLELIEDPATFAVNQALLDALPEGHTVISADNAKNHFAKQRLKDLAGIYIPTAKDIADLGYVNVIRINSDGGYIIVDLGEENIREEAGIERGILNYNINKNIFTVSNHDLRTLPENDNSLGLIEAEISIISNNQISLTFEDGTFTFDRFNQGSGDSIIGAWAVASKPVEYYPESDTYKRVPISEPSIQLNTQVFIFFADNTYVMLDPVGDDEGQLPNAPPSCGKPGVEAGKYIFANNELTFRDLIVDNNDCAGLYDNGYSSQPMGSVIHGNTMTWVTEVIDGSHYTIPFTLERVSTQTN